jgi:dTDP-4-amino-4,6-dideoxygalactose transaminase
MNVDIPFFSFRHAPESLKDEWGSAALEVIADGNFILGSRVLEFEAEWSQKLGVQGSVAVGNGFDALCIALIALGIKKGDRVAVPAHTFIACWFAIHQVGGTAVGIDVDESGLIDLEQIYNLEEVPEFVMPVHMHGKMVDMVQLMNWAQKHGVRVVEDCSQSHGALLNGKQSGTWGDIGVFSLYPTKNLGALGDAGVLVSNDSHTLQTAKQLSNYGTTQESKYRHELVGINSRLDEMQAAFLLVNLKYFDKWVSRRGEIGTLYENLIKPRDNLVVLQESGTDNSRHHFVIRSPQRNSIIKVLRSRGIATEIHYPYLAAYEYQDIKKMERHSFPVAETLASEILSLPLSPWQTDSEVTLISETLNEIMDHLD